MSRLRFYSNKVKNKAVAYVSFFLRLRHLEDGKKQSLDSSVVLTQGVHTSVQAEGEFFL